MFGKDSGGQERIVSMKRNCLLKLVECKGPCPGGDVHAALAALAALHSTSRPLPTPCSPSFSFSLCTQLVV